MPPAELQPGTRPSARYRVTSRGFFSEFNVLAYAYAHSLAHGRTLFVEIKTAAGPWWELFLGQPPGLVARPVKYGPEGEISLEPKLKDGHWNPAWGAMRVEVRDGCLERRRVRAAALDFEGTYEELVVLAARGLFQPNERLVERARAAKRAMGLDRAPYASIQLRRGDKVHGYDNGKGRFVVETRIADFADYAEALEKVAAGIEDVFVIADDYESVEEARRRYPQWRFHTLSEPHERGYFHAEQQSAAPEVQRANLEKLLTTVMIAREAEAFVGTYWSNLSIGVYLLHPHRERCVSKDLARPWPAMHPLFMRGRDEL